MIGNPSLQSISKRKSRSWRLAGSRDGMPSTNFPKRIWRADVLAVQGGKRIAFEVQWSRQTYEATRLRQERYKASNVRGCWFFRIAPKEMSDYDKTLVADKETPAFKIFKDENSNILAQVGKVQSR